MSSDTAIDAPSPEAPHVLVANDEPWMGDLLDALLSDVGYHLVRIANGADLLERLRTEADPSVVLLNLRGPPLNSRAVLSAVAADPALGTCHAFVLLTARFDMLPSDYVALLKRLSVLVVPKPFDIDVLLNAVANAAAKLHSH